MLSVITALEFFQHYFAKMGHRNTSCDPHLHPSHQATNAPLPHAKRPPPGGYVQTPLSEKWIFQVSDYATVLCRTSSFEPKNWEGTAQNSCLLLNGRV